MTTVVYRDSASLARMLAAHPDPATRPFAIVDVRDSDFQGGHIPGALNHPAHTFRIVVDDLVRQLRHKDEVVFHCMLSQTRGPTCARIFVRELERQMPDETARPRVSVLKGGFQGWVADFRAQADTLIADYDARMWGSRASWL